MILLTGRIKFPLLDRSLVAFPGLVNHHDAVGRLTKGNSLINASSLRCSGLGNGYLSSFGHSTVAASLADASPVLRSRLRDLHCIVRGASFLPLVQRNSMATPGLGKGNGVVLGATKNGSLLYFH